MQEILLRQGHAACRIGSHHGQHLPQLQWPRTLVKPCSKYAVPRILLQQTRSQSTRSEKQTLTTHSVEGIVRDLSTTRPAPLTLPDPPHEHAWPSLRSLNPTQWDFKYLFGIGKAYVAFYKAGFKNVWANYKTSRQIQARLGDVKIGSDAFYADPPKISYNEYELYLRTRRDLFKLIPFTLVFIVCGEFTPLVIIALGSSVVPGTCIIPKQEHNDIEKQLERDHYYDARVVAMLHDMDPGHLKQLENRRIRILEHELSRTGILPMPSDKPVLNYLSAAYMTLYRPRALHLFYKRFKEIHFASRLIEREGGWSKRSPQDMWEWGTKIGIPELSDYTAQALEAGEHPVSDRMKAKLLPVFQREMKELNKTDYEAAALRKYLRYGQSEGT